MHSVSVVRIKQVRDGSVRFAVAQVTGPAEVYAAVRGFYRGEGREVLSALYLDTRAVPVCFHVAAVGSPNAARCSAAELLQPALLSNANSLVLIHNHPSGHGEPSAEDLAFTRAIARACELLGVTLHDHLIVTDDGYVSLRERELMDFPETRTGHR